MFFTKPPACVMRERSLSWLGLWSVESGTVFPLRLSTPRESPAHATTRSLPRTRAATAVHPAWISCSGRVQTCSPLTMAGWPGATPAPCASEMRAETTIERSI